MTSAQMITAAPAPQHYTADMLTDRLEEIRAILMHQQSQVGGMSKSEQVRVAGMVQSTIEAIKMCAEEML